MVREFNWSHVQCTFLAIASLWPARCQADEQARRLFGISVQAVPEPGTQEVAYTTAYTTGEPLVEAPTPPPSLSTGQSLPGYSIYQQGVQETTHTKEGFGKAQWLLLGQILFVFWLLIGVLLVALFWLERCGILEKFSCCPSCCHKLEQHWHMSKAFFNVFFIVLLLACAFTGFCVYDGLFASPPTWFNRMEKAEAALITKLPFQIPGLSPTIPPPPPTQSPAVQAAAIQVQQLKGKLQQEKAAAAQKEKKLEEERAKNRMYAAVQQVTIGTTSRPPQAPLIVAPRPRVPASPCVSATPPAFTTTPAPIIQQARTQHSVTLDTSLSSSDLGMKLLPDPTTKNLLVTRITGGIVGTYNAAHPGAPIKVGDLITAVNGITGDSAKLLQECMKKQQLVLALSRQVGHPISNAVATTPAVVSKCPGSFRPWAENSVCLSNSKPGFLPGTFGWHCPWESMMLVSTLKFGGCAAVQYDCAGMDVDAVLDLYSKHGSMQTPPPEGSLQTVRYVACCIRHQCKGLQPLAKCGQAPWVPGQSVSPFAGKANPCGSEGCARRYSVTKVLNIFPGAGYPVLVVSGISLLLIVGAIAAIRRRTGGDHHHLLAENDTESCTNEVE